MRSRPGGRAGSPPNLAPSGGEWEAAEPIDPVGSRCDDHAVTEQLPVLWLCGPPGVGGTVVGWELYSQLAAADAAVAHVDIDQLGM